MNRRSVSLFSVLLSVLFLFSPTAQCADEPDATIKLADRFFSDSLYNLALEQYQKYLAVKNRSGDFEPQVNFRVGLCHYHMENWRLAAESLENYIQSHPGHAGVMDAMYLAGQCRRTLGEFKEASDWFYSVWSRFVGSVRGREALLLAAQCAQADKNPDRAIELYAQYIARFPKQADAVDAASTLIDIFIAQHEPGRVVEVIERIEKEWKGDKVVSLRTSAWRARHLKLMQKYDQAEKEYGALVKQLTAGFPERDNALADYASLLIQQKKYREALAVFEKRDELAAAGGPGPDRTFFWNWAESARLARQFDVAEKQYQHYLSAFPLQADSNLARYRLAESQAGRGELARAIETLQIIESQDSGGDFAHRAILKSGDLYYGKGLFPSAVAAYRRYLQLPDSRDKDRILFRVGQIYKDKYERYGAAVREFENLLKWYPSSSYYLQSVYAIAQCHEALQEYAAALRQYEFLIESGGEDELVERARSRTQYLTSYKIRDAEAAAFKLTSLVAMDPVMLSTFERQWTTALIYRDYLKDFTRALEVFDQLDNTSPTSDSLAEQVWMEQGVTYRMMSEKARYEKDSAMAAFAADKAIGLFSRVLASDSVSHRAATAAYWSLKLSGASSEQYVSYYNRFPRGPYTSTVLMTIAQTYERKSDNDTALQRKILSVYRTIIKNFPSDDQAPAAYLGLARNYLALDSVELVRGVLDTFLLRFSNSALEPEVLYLKGVIANHRGEYTVAIETFKQVLYRFPFSPFAIRARFELGFAELHANNIFEALNNFRTYERTYTDDSRMDQIRYGIAKCLIRLGKVDDAVAIFNEIQENQLPEKVLADIFSELGHIAASRNDSYTALANYEKVLRFPANPDRGRILRTMGGLYFDNRVYGEAANAFSRALEFSRTAADSAELLARTITSHTMNNESSKADKLNALFKDRFAHYSDYAAEIVYYEGMHLVSLKKFDKAVNRFEYIRQKIAKSPRVDDAAFQIASCYFLDKKIDDAMRLFYEFPSSYPQSEYVPQALFKIAMIKHDQDDFAQAADYFARVARHEAAEPKTRFRAAYNAAVAYQKISAWEDAASLYAVVLRDFPAELPASSLNLKIGFCLLQANKVEQALAHFQQANLEPATEDKPEILYWIASCYSRLGEYQKAIGEYLKVPYLYAEMGKWGVTAEMEAARLYERQNEYGKAISLYNKIVRSDGEQGRFGKHAQQRIQILNNLAETP